MEIVLGLMISPLMEMEFNTEGLGSQMDADHVVTDPEHQSTMTEFSQVISALEAMGFTHSMAKMAYKDLGRVALSSIGGIRDAVYTLVGINLLTIPMLNLIFMR